MSNLGAQQPVKHDADRCDSVASIESALGRIVTWFEALTPDTLSDIGHYYASNARFKDPFNDVCGVQSIYCVYQHMFENLQSPRFVIDDTIVQGDRAFVNWTFTFTWRHRRFEIPGGTRMLLDETGRITNHTDYWDPAAGLYEKLPVVGVMLRFLRRRMSALGASEIS